LTDQKTLKDLATFAKRTLRPTAAAAAARMVANP